MVISVGRARDPPGVSRRFGQKELGGARRRRYGGRGVGMKLGGWCEKNDKERELVELFFLAKGVYSSRREELELVLTGSSKTQRVRAMCRGSVTWSCL